MNRPNINNTRDQVAQFNVSAHELRRIDAAAQTLGLRRAQYLRMITLAALGTQEEEATREPKDEYHTLGPVTLRGDEGVY